MKNDSKIIGYIKFLAPYVKPFTLRIAAALALVLLSKMANVSVPLIMKRIVDSMDPGLAALTVPLGLLAAYGLLRILATFFEEFRKLIYTKITVTTMRNVSLRVFSHLLNLGLRFHLGRQTGRIIREVERGQNSIIVMTEHAFFTIFPTLVECALAFGILIYFYDWTFIAIAFTTLAVYVVFTFRVTEWRVTQRRKFNECASQESHQLADSLLNYETVKYFINEKWEEDRYNNKLINSGKAWIETAHSMLLLQTGQALILALALTLMLWRATAGIAGGVMSVGDLVLISTLMMQLYMPLNFLGMIYREIRQAVVDMERLMDLNSETMEINDAPDAAALKISGGEVRFEGVNFAYNSERKILKGVSFTIPAGKTLALVGASGAGKSTVSRLIFRMYDPGSGTIYVDGQDIRAVTQISLRAAIAIVPQDTVLFNDTIGYNIAYGRPGATQEEVEEAARMAQLDKFIRNLPDGYNTVVGERGLKLSGGEKQRVSIARALLKNPAIFVFDEATSSLDSNAEKEIQKEIDKIAMKHTTLIIAHRLSTVVGADEIVVLEHGRVAERGNHAQLLAQEGAYAKMWRLQQAEADMQHMRED